MTDLEALNRSLFLILNAPDGTSAWRIDPAIALGEGLIYAIPALLAVLWIRGDADSRSLAVRAAVVAMLAVGMNQLIGMVWFHPRPFMIGLGHTWGPPHTPDSSLPSDHATVISAVAISLFFGGRTALGCATASAGLAIAWARIYLGVHFPLDMMAAPVVALIAYAISTPLWRLIGAPLAARADTLYRKVVG